MITSTRSDYTGLLDPYYSLVYFFCFVFAVILVITWWQYYKATQNKYALIPISLPAVLALSMIGISIYQTWRKDVPVFFRAGIEGFSLELRKNGTYKMNSFGEFSSDSYYGDFIISEDTIVLNHAPLTSGKFLLILNDPANDQSLGILREIDYKRKEELMELPISIYEKNNR